MSCIEEMAPQIEERQPPPPEKKQKIEGAGAEERDDGEKGSIARESSDKKEASKPEEGGTDEEDDSDDESCYEWVSDDSDHDYVKFYKNLPERLLNIVKSPPEPNPDIDYCPIGNYEVDWDLWDEYYKQIEETEGFGVKVYPCECPNAYLRPLPFFKEHDGYNKLITQLADLAIKEFNMNNNGKEFKVVDVEWVVDSPARGILYYLTFTAEDPKEGVKTFEAKVLDGIGDEQEVELCRIKK